MVSCGAVILMPPTDIFSSDHSGLNVKYFSSSCDLFGVTPFVFFTTYIRTYELLKEINI